MECFTIMSNEIEGRIDPAPYHQIRLSTIKKIKNSKFHLFPLKEVAEFTKKLVISKAKDLVYIGLENIESNTGIFIPSEERKESFGTAIKFEKGNILFPKLRPYLNKVYLAEFDGVCSTEFHVLEAKKCDRMYLFCFLNSQLVVNQTSYLMTGNTLPRLQTAEVENLLIPLPPLAVQNKIVQLMDKAYSQKKEKESEAQKLLDSINDYVLDELGIKFPELKDKMCFVVYSDDVKNNRCDAYYFQPKFEEIEKAIKKGKFDLMKIEEKVDLLNQVGKFKDTSKIDYVDLSSIDKNSGYVIKTKNMIVREAPSRAKQKIDKGDLLISSLSGSLKSISVYDREDKNSVASTGFHIIKDSELYNNYYLFALFRTPLFQGIIQRETTGAIMSAINRDCFKQIKIPLPPLLIQNKIADEVKQRMEKAEQLKKEAKEELEKAKQEVEKIILEN